MSVRQCPKCRSLFFDSSRRKGFLETTIFRLLLLRPYRCADCHHRFYGSAIGARIRRAVSHEEEDDE